MTDDGAELSRLALDGSSPCEDVDADFMSLGFGEVGLKEKQIRYHPFSIVLFIITS